jgi:hypothetical protein
MSKLCEGIYGGHGKGGSGLVNSGEWRWKERKKAVRMIHKWVADDAN